MPHAGSRTRSIAESRCQTSDSLKETSHHIQQQLSQKTQKHELIYESVCLNAERRLRDAAQSLFFCFQTAAADP